MTDRTIQTYEAFIRNHHDDKTFDCIERCYSMWDFLHRNKDDVKFITFMKEKGLTDFNLYACMAIGMLKPWVNKEDLYYERSVYYQVLPHLSVSRVNEFGEVDIQTHIRINTGTLPATVEEYIELQKKPVDVVEVIVAEDETFNNPFKENVTN